MVANPLEDIAGRISRKCFLQYVNCPPDVRVRRDLKHLTMLKRYLRSQYGMSPDEYRKKWGLPHDYPMVAPAYARLRSAFAKKSGLGRVPSGAKGRRTAQQP